MKRILQVTGSLVYGGTEAFIMNNYRNIDKTKYQFDFYILYPECINAYVEEIESMGGKIFKGKAASIRSIRSAEKKIIRVLQENGPYDAVHCHVNFGNAWLLHAAKRAGVPVRICHSHAASGKLNGLFKIYSYIQMYIIKRYATRFLACSRQAGNYLYGEKYFNKNGVVIQNGIDIERMYSEEVTSNSDFGKEWNIPKDCNEIFGNITRFDENKNQVFLLDVFKEYLKINPKALLILGGPDGGMLTAIKNKAIELNIENQIRFIGVRNDISSCLAMIDCYIFPSLKEGFGIAVIEAQAMGCECFASDTVSREVDLGMGNIHFVSLADSSVAWAEYIHKCRKTKLRIPREKIIKAFQKKGLCIQMTVKELMRVYDGW